MNDDKKTPFFARYLEGQELPTVRTDVKAGKGPPLVTKKWPSDDDELDQTMKAPSDSDEI